MSSKIRSNYSKISKTKKDFGPLSELITEKFKEITIEVINSSNLSEFNIVKDKIENLLTNVLKLNVKPKQENAKINYDLINNIQNRKDIYHPSKDEKPKQVNKPLNRNEIFELKKGTLAEQNLRMFGGKKKNRF
jgi:hypothetical protein